MPRQKLPPEEKKARKKAREQRRRQSLTPEQRTALSSGQWRKLTPDQRTAREKRRWRNWTPEQRAASVIRSTKWKRENPRKWYAICLKARTAKKYGLTIEALHQMLENQEGLCFICLKLMCLCDAKNCPSRACVDHDHVTNKVRGLLCKSCNRMLGIVHDSPFVLKNAIGYLEMSS